MQQFIRSKFECMLPSLAAFETANSIGPCPYQRQVTDHN